MVTATKTRTPRKRGPKSPALRDAKKRAFLASYAKLGVITEAAEAAEIDPGTVTRWREADPEFAAAEAAALARSVDEARIELRRRGITGWDEVTVKERNGEIVEKVTTHRFSDGALFFFLKHADHSYRERYDVNVSGEVVHTFDPATEDALVERFASFKQAAIEATAIET